MAVVDGVPFQNLSMRPSRTWWQRSTDPLLNVPSAAERHRKEGAEAFFAGLRPKELPEDAPRPPLHFTNIESPWGAVGGGLQWAMSPFAGAFESLWDKPASGVLQEEAGVPKKYADPIASLSGLALPVVGFGGIAAKAANLDKVLDPRLWKGFTGKQRTKVGASGQIAGGEPVFVRLNLNVAPKEGASTKTDHMLTFHGTKKSGGPEYSSAIAYDQGAALKNVSFHIDQPSRIAIAGREQTKTPIASVGGQFRSVSYKTMEGEMKNADAVATFNPAKGNFFVDVKTNAPIKSADKAVLVGDKVYLKGNVKHHERSLLTPAEESGIIKTDFPINWKAETQQYINNAKIIRLGEELWPISETGYGVPRGPQYPLEREYYKKELDIKAAEEKWDKLITPANIQKTIQHVDRGLSKGGFEWYDLEPLRYRMIEELGPKIGNQRFLEYVQMIAATSPGSMVPSNIKRASYFYHLLNNPKATSPQQALKLWAEGQPPGYGHRYDKGTHQPLLKTTFEHPYNKGLFTTDAAMNQPKASSFAHNISGNLMPGTVDMHINRMMTAGIEQGSPQKLVYAYPEKVLKDIAEKKGLTTAQTQAAGWIDYMKGESRPLLILFDEAIRKTATKRGKTPDQILKDWINGEVPLASVLPMGAAQLGTDLADDIFGEKLIG